MKKHDLQHAPLGKRSAYLDTYDSSLLFPILRQPKRAEIGIGDNIPFYGYDLWTAYELSWLNTRGKPRVALADIIIDCRSDYILESKSFKLYLNSFNNTQFASALDVQNTLIRDLSNAVGFDVTVRLLSEGDFKQVAISQMDGVCLDDLDIGCNEYQVNPGLLKLGTGHVRDVTLYSHLLKSNCLVTGQPDWGSIEITYSGPTIEPTSLLQYLVSFRNHNEFHEQCVERVFMDIQTYCSPSDLTVYARYTRRGGLDINPIRSTKSFPAPDNGRLFRQ